MPAIIKWVHDDDDNSICRLCARLNDLPDFDMCSNCCYALAQAQEGREEPDGMDNFIGWACRKLGVGTLPVMLIVAEEVCLTHMMHHYVFLPTPVGYEMTAFCLDLAKKMKAKGSLAWKHVLKFESWMPGSRRSGSAMA